MKRRHVYAVVGLVAGTLLFLGCGNRESPVEPTPPVQATPAVAPAFQDFRLSGAVSDTANRPLAGSKVEVVDGPRAGTFATTDESGRFSMPGTFTGNIALTASKDGYQQETRPVLPRGIPPPSGTPRSEWSLAFRLEPFGPSANIAGVYTLTLTADNACTDFPAEARTRTYTATIVPGQSSFFLARLSDARFLPMMPCPPGPVVPSCTYNQFGIGMAGDYANLGVSGIVEQLGQEGYVAITAGAEGSFGPTGITTPLSGSFLYCPSEPYQIDIGEWACRASNGVDCYSRNHQLSLVRR
jgi:hypothetical protein